MNIDGRQIAREIVAELATYVRSSGLAPSLGIVVVGDNPVIESFVRIKAKTAAEIGVSMERISLPESASQDEVIAAIEELRGRTRGLIVQLPLPASMDTDAVLARIPRDLDVDGINPAGSDFTAPVALAVGEILRRAAVDVAGKRAIVIGAGRLVGRPASILLESLGAEVSVITRDTASLDRVRDAHIIVSGAGQPAMITPDLIAEGAVLIDAGTSESGGKVRGDADPACAEKCSVFTPVPGGVGPIAVAMIFKNLLRV